MQKKRKNRADKNLYRYSVKIVLFAFNLVPEKNLMQFSQVFFSPTVHERKLLIYLSLLKRALMD